VTPVGAGGTRTMNDCGQMIAPLEAKRCLVKWR
jgi:hypothetical protein